MLVDDFNFISSVLSSVSHDYRLTIEITIIRFPLFAGRRCGVFQWNVQRRRRGNLWGGTQA